MTGTRTNAITLKQGQPIDEDPVFASSQNSSLIEKRRQQIVDGACKIFFKKGYHPTTIRDIANACGMSIGQLYHYISSKDDVLYLVHKYSQAIWYDYLKKSKINQIDDPKKKLTEALRYSLEFIIENRKLIQFIYSESKYLDKRYLQIVLDLDHKNIVGFWRGLLNEIKKTTSLEGDLDIMGSLIAYLIAFPALRGWTLKDKPNEEQVDALVEFILKGLAVNQ
jgi:AcrR family transcriptional regulator